MYSIRGPINYPTKEPPKPKVVFDRSGLWSADRDKILKSLYFTMSANEVADRLGINVRTVYDRAVKLGIRKYKDNAPKATHLFERVHEVAVAKRDFLLLDKVPSPIEKIIRETCEKYRLTVSELVSDRQSRSVSWPRQEAFYLASKAGMTLIAIGKAFDRDHTTVLSGIKRYQERMGL